MKKIFIASILLSLFSCKKNEQETVHHIYNATMRVSAFQEQASGNGQIIDIPIADVSVQLFKTEYDRENQQDVVLAVKTDSAGLAQFFNLGESYYYIKADHPSFGEVLDETSTPDGSVSFVDIVY